MIAISERTQIRAAQVRGAGRVNGAG
jgi:hypothetical protein